MEVFQPTGKLAVIIAIEDYRNKPHIPSVSYARNDAEAFKKMLIEHLDYAEKDIIYWIDGDAVQNTLTNDLPYYIQGLSPDHQFIFYFAGHAFYQDGVNRLTCWDSHPFNLPGTTVSLKEILFDPLEKSGCQQSIVFLDCCATVLTDKLNARDIISDMTPKEFDAFVRTGKYDAVFLSCSAGEKSSSNGVIKHGIWTYHVIQAISGNADGSIVKERFITSNSLQNYLSVAIPKFIREQKDKYAPQTPYARIGSGNEFLIRELPEIEVDISLPALELNLGDVHLRKISETEVKRGRGFQKGWIAPKFVNRTTQRFVQDVFFGESKEEIAEIAAKTKELFGLRDGNINYDCQKEGGFVTCVYFDFRLSVEQHDTDPRLAVITREIHPLVPLKDLPTDFDSIFPIGIDELIIPIKGKIDFAELTNKFENLIEQERQGKLEVNRMDETIEYITANHTSLKIRTEDGELIVTRYRIMGALQLIRDSIADIQQLSQERLQLLGNK